MTLTWIKSHALRWKDYVRNRVSQIQELSQHAQCRHVPGTSNAADCASRGLTTSQLEHHKLWWTGSPWLSQPSDSCSSQSSLKDDSSALEARPGISNLLNIQKIVYHWNLIYRYSTFNKLICITPVCFRVLSRLGKSPTSLPIISLTAFIDAQGVIRVGGRLNNAHMGYGSKHSPLLPRSHNYSDSCQFPNSIIHPTTSWSAPWCSSRMSDFHRASGHLRPGKDGLTRLVTLKTATTTLIRPIAKLAILPVSDLSSSSST